MLNWENIGEEVAQVVNPSFKIPKKIYLASDKEIPLVQNGFLKFETNEGSKLEPCWNKKLERMIWFISGMSGSGKSFYAGLLLKKYKKLYPKNEIYIFSSVNEDKSFDNMKVNRINLEGLLSEDLQSDDFANSIVIFDDCDCLTNKNIKNKVLSIQNQILEKGRHHNVSCVVTSHISTDGTSTKKILNESMRIVVFPQNANGRTLKYLLENYLGFDRHQIKYMKELKTRPLTICKSYPQIVLTDNMITFSKDMLKETE
jgi:hypothetical protein